MIIQFTFYYFLHKLCRFFSLYIQIILEKFQLFSISSFFLHNLSIAFKLSKLGISKLFFTFNKTKNKLLVIISLIFLTIYILARAIWQRSRILDFYTIFISLVISISLSQISRSNSLVYTQKSKILSFTKPSNIQPLQIKNNISFDQDVSVINQNQNQQSQNISYRIKLQEEQSSIDIINQQQQQQQYEENIEQFVHSNSRNINNIESIEQNLSFYQSQQESQRKYIQEKIIKEENKLEETFSSAVLDNLANGIVLIDSNFQVCYSNKQMNNIFGQHLNKEFIYKKLISLIIIDQQIQQNTPPESKDSKRSKKSFKQNDAKQKYVNSQEIYSKSNFESQNSKIGSYEQSSNKIKKQLYYPTSNNLTQTSISQKQQSYSNKSDVNGFSIQVTGDLEEIASQFQSSVFDKQKSKYNYYKKLTKSKSHDDLSEFNSKLTNQQFGSIFNNSDLSVRQNFSFQSCKKSKFNSPQIKPNNIKTQQNYFQFPCKLKKKIIPASVLGLFNKKYLNLFEIIDWIFTTYGKNKTSNHWSSNDIEERKSKCSGLEQTQSDLQINCNNENILYFFDNNNLIIHFKDRQACRNFDGIRIGLIIDKQQQQQQQQIIESKEVNPNHLTSNYLLIEFFNKAKLAQNINNKEIIDYKNKMLASVSHELRTPLNCSIQMLQMLMSKQEETIRSVEKQFDDDIQELYIKPALNSNLLLLHIINDIVDYGQINNGQLKLEFSSFSIFDLVTECVEMIIYQASLKSITIEINFDTNIPFEVHSDANRMRQVLLNLLTNSLKFTTKGAIMIKVELEGNDVIKIEVSDTGCGISEKQIMNLFEAFGNKDTGKYMNTRGAGLGMSITNNLAMRLGGNRRIKVTSKPNEGSKFVFYVVNRAKHKKGCQYKMKDIFNKKVVQWESLSRMDTGNLPMAAISSRQQIPGGSVLKRIFCQHFATQDIQLSPHANSKGEMHHHSSTQQFIYPLNEKQENTKLISDKHNLEKSMTIINNTQQNTLTLTLRPSQRLIENQKQYQSFTQFNFPSQQTEMKINAKTNTKQQQPQQCSILENDFMNTNTNTNSNNCNNTNPEINSFQTVQSKEISCYQNIQKQQKSEIIYDHPQTILETDEDKQKSYLQINESNNKNGQNKYFQENKQMYDEFQPSIIQQVRIQISESSKKQQYSNGLEFRNHSQFMPVSPDRKPSTPIKNKKNNHHNQQKVTFDEQQLSSFKNPEQIHPPMDKRKLFIQNLNLDLSCDCPQILIVDDNDFNLYALQMSLKSLGFLSDKASSGLIALEKIIQRTTSSHCCTKYTLIFMDIDMPVMDGHETTKEIIRYFNQNNQHHPLISACSAYIQENERIKAQKSGMKYYLTKPINQKELQTILINSFLTKK